MFRAIFLTLPVVYAPMSRLMASEGCLSYYNTLSMTRLRSFLVSLSILAACLAAFAQARSNKTEIAQNLNIFNSIYKELQTNYVDSIDARKSIRNAIDYMLSEIDPYTEYYPNDEREELLTISTGEYAGIGCTIVQRDGRVVLSEPRSGTPSREAGVMHGDILVAIDGDTLPKGYSTADASKRLRGQAGTKVRLTVQRPFVADSILDIVITRGKIQNNPVPYYGMLPGGIGYISLSTFSEKSAPQVREALLKLKKNPDLRGLVLDLRDNGGGLLESAVQIVSLFVPKGTEVVRTRYREGKEKIYRTTQSPVDTELPLVVMVNGGTASSSEIVSGALQDLDRAVIAGSRSYGKGLVQTTRPIPYDGLLKVTVARYYIPSGRLVQAIDYSHRDARGNVTRVPDSLTHVYHTLSGREVRDGGGITPDVLTKKKEMTTLVYTMLTDFWASDYATRYRAVNGPEIAPASDFTVGDSIYEDFKRFVIDRNYKYRPVSSDALDELRKMVKREGYLNDSVGSILNSLQQALNLDLKSELDLNKKEIIDMLDMEISMRYYDEADCVRRALRYDTEIDEAAAVLSDPERYRALLLPQKEK